MQFETRYPVRVRFFALDSNKEMSVWVSLKYDTMVSIEYCAKYVCVKYDPRAR